MDEMISVYVSETGESPFAVRIETGGHSLIGDETPAVGGADLGPAPFQLLTAALGECTAMTVRWYARQQNWPLEHVSVDITHEKITVEGSRRPVDSFRKTITLKGDALTDEQRKRLLDVASKCPVQRSLEGTPSITTLAA